MLNQLLPEESYRYPGRSPSDEWSYKDAFCRNRGLITAADQERLRRSHVAVAGLGGVGGSNLVGLARLGIGNFTIADPDIFEVHNSNRQYGATKSTQGRLKTDVMANIVWDINPEAKVKIFSDFIRPENADAFLEGADVLVDGIDAFEIDVRRLLFRKARERGVYALGGGPVGFSAAWTLFSPESMTYDRYFDFSDGMSQEEQFVAYIVGMAPASTQREYTDLSYLNVGKRTGPSAGLACSLVSGIIAAEVLKIILGRGRLYPAPYYHQFDAYTGRLVRGRLLGGNKNPFQKLKQRWLLNYLHENSKASVGEGKIVRGEEGL